jgi:hypothetical protein
MTGGELLGEVWARGDYSGAPNPLSGTCETIAPDVLEVHYDDDFSATCSATKRSRLFLFFGSLCFSFDEGSGPSTEEQLACAVRGDEAIDELNVTIDEGRTIALVRRKFELFSPQRTAQLPDGPATFTAHAWGAVVRNLHPGSHTVELELVAPGFGGTFTFTIVVEVS